MVLRQLEVRYCDDQRRLLGWIQVPPDLMVLGKELTVIRPRPAHPALALTRKGITTAPERATFKVTSLPSGFGMTYLALKADGFTAAECAELLEKHHFVPVR